MMVGMEHIVFLQKAVPRIAKSHVTTWPLKLAGSSSNGDGTLQCVSTI